MLESGRFSQACRPDHYNFPPMVQIANGDYIHRSVHQLGTEQPPSGTHHDYKQFTDLTNRTVADYAIKVDRNSYSNSLIDNRIITSNPSNLGSNLAQVPNVEKIYTVKSDHQLNQMRKSKPYQCTQCTKSFANSSYLSQHTRIHLGVKPHHCNVCHRKFTQLSHLQQHSRTHTGDKPYKCRIPGCVKAFSQLANLQSHSRCHAKDKPFKCKACYKCFADETALLDHIPKHKESKRLRTNICQHCGKSYTQESYLAKHLEKHVEQVKMQAPKVSSNQQQTLQYSKITDNSNGNDGSELVGKNPLAIRQNPQHHAPIVAASSPYDSAGKLATNSAFTPLGDVMQTQLNSLQHHQLALRPNFNDLIAFQSRLNNNVQQ